MQPTHSHTGARIRRLLATAALVLLAGQPLRAQHLRDRLSDLFIFGGESPLNLGGTSDPNNPDSIRIHGSHFVPAAVASNGTVISFLTNSIGSNVAAAPELALQEVGISQGPLNLLLKAGAHRITIRKGTQI